jgi:hypothetical protein
MDLEPIIELMEMCMLVNGSTIRSKEKGLTPCIMGMFMMENGKMENEMVGESRLNLMTRNTKGNG